jgi:hypothetical protein
MSAVRITSVKDEKLFCVRINHVEFVHVPQSKVTLGSARHIYRSVHDEVVQNVVEYRSSRGWRVG